VATSMMLPQDSAPSVAQRRRNDRIDTSPKGYS
jgi:hypothetical protein